MKPASNTEGKEKVEVGTSVSSSSLVIEHKHEEEGGLIFSTADYSLVTTHSPPLTKPHPKP